MGLEKIGNYTTYESMSYSELDEARLSASERNDASAIYDIRQTAFTKWDTHEDEVAPWRQLIVDCTDDITRILKQEGFN